MNTAFEEKVIAFAKNAHEGTMRKGTDIPYVSHVIEAAEIAKTITDDKNVIAACYLHDTLEDTDTTYEDLVGLAGKDVADLVAAVSEDKMKDVKAEKSWKTRKLHTIHELAERSDVRVKIIVFCDKLSNIRAINKDHSKLGSKVWERFNQKDPAMHAWYYGMFLGLCSELSGTDAYNEYLELFRKTFLK